MPYFYKFFVSFFTRFNFGSQFFFKQTLIQFVALCKICQFLHLEKKQILFVDPSGKFKKVAFLFKELLGPHYFFSNWKNGFLTNLCSGDTNVVDNVALVVVLGNFSLKSFSIAQECSSVCIPSAGFICDSDINFDYPVIISNYNFHLQFILFITILFCLSFK